MRLFMNVVALVGLIVVPTLVSAQDLTLKRVMLSSGGLGYFEYEASVEGDATLKLTVSLGQVDDVLKSLVVYDDKGGVGGLSLPGREPLAQAFKDLPFDQNSLASPADLLATLKGAQVTVGGSRALSGRIVSVEEDPLLLPDNKGTVKRTRVTLYTDRGLQQFILEDAEDLQFSDSALREKVAQALVAIQSNRAKDARTLELSARGQGKRLVRVAYVVEAPVWKAAYRLTLPADATAPKSSLQGWAVVENMSGQDWKDVELTLVSGRPVAFRQALYNAYYVTRTDVPVEVAGRLNPFMDRGGVSAPEVKRAQVFAPPPAPPAAPPLPAPSNYMTQRSDAGRSATPQQATNVEQIEATDAATQVVFRFPQPVNVANGRTLSIPVVDRQIPGKRLALFQSDTSARNPLAAIRLINDGDTGLPPGVITIYERDKANQVSYVGDARLSSFPVGETRLLAYALDEKITIERDVSQNERMTGGTISQGVLKLSQVLRQTTTYRVRGAAKEARELLILQRRLPGWTLTKPEAKDIELSEGSYRVPFQLSGNDQTFEVVQEQTQQQEIRLVESAAEQIRVYAQAREFDAKTREQLTRVLQLQQAAAEAQRKVAQVDAERQAIVQEQARLRENLARVPPNSDLQRRYLATLDKQETDLEALANRRAEAEKAAEGARAALRTYVSQLG